MKTVFLFIYQANQTLGNYASQCSLDSVASVPDLTDRVVRVSFAPEGATSTRPAVNQVPEELAENADIESVSNMSIGKTLQLMLSVLQSSQVFK